MRSNVECRRCGCGAIVGLRESCPKCAAAQRVRLHADGVGDSEGREIPSLSMWAGKELLRKDTPPDEPVRYSISLADRYEGIIEAAVAQLKYDKELDDMYAFAEELEAQLQQAKVANQRGVIDAALADVAVAGVDWGREDGGAIVTGVRHPDGTFELTGHFQIPAIGEVVSWEVAKADMQARPEASYKTTHCKWLRRWLRHDRLQVSIDGAKWREEMVRIGCGHAASEWVRVA